MDDLVVQVPTNAPFTVMDLEALDGVPPVPDDVDLLYYLTGQPHHGHGVADSLLLELNETSPAAGLISPLLLSQDFPCLDLHSAAPTSSPSSSSGASPVASPPPSSTASPPSADSPHALFEEELGSWIEATLEAPMTMPPGQLGPLFSPRRLADSSSDEGSPKARKKDTRKRKRAKKNEAPVQTAVTLPREELLKLSSQELEDYAENLRKVRKLTAEEEKDIRRQRRLIKNRESAQLSRVRKREQLEVLEQELQEAHAENARLKRQVDSLSQLNRQLKDHIASMGCNSRQRQTAPASPPLLSPAECSGKSRDEDDPSLLKMIHTWTTLGKGTTTTAVKATYLFVLLLSIGLFLNARHVHYGPSLGPFEMRGTPDNQIPASAFSQQTILTPESNSRPAMMDTSQRRHRDILQVDESDVDFNGKHMSSGEAEVFTHKAFESFSPDPLADSVRPWRKETPTFPLQTSSTTPVMTTGEAANKTILMCPNVTPVQCGGDDQGSRAASDEITFILPASSATLVPRALFRAASSTFQQTSGSMVQLTCKVVEARSIDLGPLLVP